MLHRKSKPVGWIEPMPKTQFRKIEKAFKRLGGTFVIGDEADLILDIQEAEASTFNEKIVLFRQHPSRAAVYEELIHTAQYRDGKCDGSRKSRLLNEIEAKEILVKNSLAYELTEIEISNTMTMLKICQDELKRLNKEEQV